MKDIAEVIPQYIPGNNRSQIRITGSNTLICDSYNANPSSMKLALENFAKSGAAKKMCILGDMLELGDKSEEEHMKIIGFLSEKGFSEVLLTGPVFAEVSKGSPFKVFSNIDALKDFIASSPPRGYTILVKGSRGIALERLYDLL
jgi:UDP-N-acetylmuramoyl-tripeptide--D-alanyl-D-alanine ligase